MQSDTKKRKICLPLGVACGLFVVAAVGRMWAAWCSRVVVDMDASVVGLMARRMAEGSDLPLFFYGQSYMGSLEPMVSAALMWLFGASGFVLNLGPALVSMAALYFLWRWARDAAGEWGGVVALALAVIGPAAYFQFQVAPRGGYMVALCVNAWVLWLASRWAAEWQERPPSGAKCAGLGLLVGVGLWSNMIVAAAVLTAFLLLLWAMKWAFHRYIRQISGGLLGVAAGLAPLWVTHLLAPPSSWEMGITKMQLPWRVALQNVWERWVLLQEPTRQWPAWGLCLALAGVVLAGSGVLALAATWNKRGRLQQVSGTAAVLFGLIFSAVFLFSGYTYINTPRYWIPLVPGVAVLAGIAFSACTKRLLRVVFVLCMVLIMAAQVWLVAPGLVDSGRDAPKQAANYRAIVDALLNDVNTRELYAPLQLYPLNFFSGEAVVVDEGRKIFDACTARALEEAPSPAFFGTYKGIEAFLELSAAAYVKHGVGRHELIGHVQRNSMPLKPVALKDNSIWLADGRVDTVFTPADRGVAGAQNVIRVELAAAAPLHALHLWPAHPLWDSRIQPPDSIRIEGLQADGTWKTLIAAARWIPLEWSGPRVYPSRGFSRIKYALDGGIYSALTITLTEGKPSTLSPWALSEIRVFQKDDTVAPVEYTAESVKDLAAVIQRGARMTGTDAPLRLYAGRWLAVQLVNSGVVAESEIAGLNPELYVHSPQPEFIDATHWRTVCIVENKDAASSRAVLQKSLWPFEEVVAAGWTVFFIPCSPPRAPETPLIWAGEQIFAVASPAAIVPQEGALFKNGIILHEAAATATNGMLTLAYRWGRETDALKGKNHTVVFVHVVDEAGTLLAQDDHMAPVLLKYRPMQSIATYQRSISLPENVDASRLTVRIGLYEPNRMARRVKITQSSIPYVNDAIEVSPRAE